MTPSSLFALISFSLAWWLGLYLLGRDLRNPQLRFTGMGLITYALALAADLLVQQAAGPDMAALIARWGWPFFFLPALFWIGSLVYLLPTEAPLSKTLTGITNRLLFPLAIVFYFVAGGTSLIIARTEEDPVSGISFIPGPLYNLLAVILVAVLLVSLLLLGRSFRQKRLRPLLGLILVATLFFGLGLSLVLWPVSPFPRWFMALGVGFDIALLGIAIALLDAFNQGEALLPDFFRSLAVSLFTVLIFGGQVALVMVLATGATPEMMVLLLATIATAIAVQAFSDPIQAGLDWLVFARIPRIRQTRADSRAVARATTRAREVLDPETLSQQQLDRLTRRALSQMGNLPRLAASPLTRLAIIEKRLSKRGADDNTLERAAELKLLLAESINRLKPREQGDFGTSDAWRFYNALYFPYVVGIKPYSRRVDHDGLDPPVGEALSWFQAQVPERTLYNWQTAAAKLVAQDLREQSANWQ